MRSLKNNYLLKFKNIALIYGLFEDLNMIVRVVDILSEQNVNIFLVIDALSALDGES
jgi:hypothetical protein